MPKEMDLLARLKALAARPTGVIVHPLQPGVLLDLTLPFTMTNGNDGRGSRWFKSSKVREQFEHDMLVLGLKRTPFSRPVTVHATRILGPDDRLWDSSSIGRGNYKELEDSFVALGWFHNDSCRWIRETRFFQDATRKANGPAIRIQVLGSEKGSAE